MSRTKKSRKPGTGSSGAKKIEKTEKTVTPEKHKRIRKKTGNQAGSRQTVANKNDTDAAQNVNKDPRLGSKKPIALGTVEVKSKTVKASPAKKIQKDAIAPIRTSAQITPQEALRQELASIENDELLLDIVEKQEQELPLTEDEVNHYNKLMDRHEEITDQLDLDDEEESTENDSTTAGSSEEQLWDKFNNSDFDKEF